jgi:hypothetical protein
MADFITHVALGESRTAALKPCGAAWIENPRASPYSPISLLRLAAITGRPGL